MTLINSNVLNSNLQRFYYSNYISSNFINNWVNWGAFDIGNMCKYSDLKNCNHINNYAGPYSNNRYYMLAIDSDKPVLDHSDYPSYLGSSREDLIRPYLYEIGNVPGTFGKIDLSNMPSQPYAEPHGILWKVVVN